MTIPIYIPTNSTGGLKKRGLYYIAGENVNWHSYYRKQYGGSWKIKTKLTHDSEITLLDTYLKGMKSLSQKKQLPRHVRCSIAAIAKMRNNLSAHQQKNGQRRCNTHIHMHTHTRKYYAAIKNQKKRKSCHLQQHRKMDGPRGHYTRWIKLDRQILYAIPYRLESEKQELTKTEQIGGYQMLGRWRRCISLKGTTF